MIAFHWYAPPPPPVESVQLETPVRLAATDWNQPLGESIRPAVHTVRLDAPGALRAISIPICCGEVQVRSFTFPSPCEAAVGDASEASGTALRKGDSPIFADTKIGTVPRGTPSGSAAAGPQGQTRIKPPEDVIKLEDRLHYLLQPSLESLLAERSLSVPLPPFPFQFEGIAFLYPRQAAILADEMGLGKTMQAIMAIRLLLRRGEVQSVLLVCPKPLVSNWRREFGLWAPELPLLLVEGDQARRIWQWQLPDVPVRIVNYEVLCRDREAWSAAGRAGVHFDLVVLDEAQRIKNCQSNTSEVVCSIPRRRSWALTGTPVENSADDLVGIFEFLAPGFLSPELKPRALGRTVHDHVLRRTKEQVLAELPPKMFRDAELELTPEQRAAYQLAEREGIFKLAELGEAVTIRHVFELVLRLKQICNFDPASGASSKLERLEADLDEIARSGRKAIVFSQWVGTLERLAVQLRRLGPLRYHGRVPAGRREAVIRRFRDDPRAHVLLISYGAGGVGLNLQFAGYVFLFDRWWNPAVEDQAINRAHRIGAAGPVTVSRFLVLETIEERIDRILQEKRDLFDTIFSGAGGRRSLGLTQQEVFGLFQLKCPKGPIDAAA
jgi:SNF2 family DNA or RNA helicase